MSQREILTLFQLPSGRYIPCGLNIWQQLWWRFMPGAVLNVRWPSGNIVVDHKDAPGCVPLFGGAVWADLGFSADPNDHYRPYLEKNVGRQGWDWQWGLADQDAIDYRLTIKIRRKHAHHATILAMRWS